MVIYKDFLEIKKVQHAIPLPFNDLYKYNNRGNRLTSLSHFYTYNDLNQLVDSTTHTYTYDADGNLIEEKNKLTTETKKYYYDSENRLIGFEHYQSDASTADIIATYKYDIQGRRLQKNVNGTVINFFWEDDNLALELDKNLKPVRRYVYGVRKDDVEGYVELSEVTGGMFDQYKKGWYSYVKDKVGTIYKVYSDYIQQMVDSRIDDVSGNMINQSRTSTGNIGFQGKYFDQESGLYYFYHRYYNPLNGRFINEDPLKIELDLDKNLYRFSKNNPINKTDPLGLAPKPYKASECCEEKEKLKKRLELVKWLIKYWKSRPSPKSHPTHGPKGKPLVPIGTPETGARPELSKCVKRCVEIHESVPSHKNPGSMSLAASEVQGYYYEKWCLEYELGLVNYWRWPF
jgi:RHS repeat-associated protein